MSSGIDDLVKISPPVWPGKQLEVQPGDLSLFAPMGIGIAGPFPVMPWDDLASALSRPGCYSYHAHSNHPFLGDARRVAYRSSLKPHLDPETLSDLRLALIPLPAFGQ